MVIKGEHFRKKRTNEEKKHDKSKVIPVRLNKDELNALTVAGLILEQEKLSSVIKTLMNFGLIVIHKEETTAVLEAVFKNKLNNKRQGITVVEPKFTQM